MNKKQNFVLAFGIVSLALIVIFTPRYKITRIDSKNFIKTEQSSSLYKRSTGVVKLHWDKIIIYAILTILTCGILIFTLRDKRDKNGNDNLLDQRTGI